MLRYAELGIVELGRVVPAISALEVLHPEDVTVAIRRHASGDWGEVSEHDRRENEQALLGGSRVVSIYRDRRGTKFYVVTCADRSATTVLLPDEC